MTPLKHNVLILGAGYAGMMSALRLSRTPGVGVTLVNAAPHFVERIRLHQLAAGQTLRARPIPALLAGTAVRFVQARATRVNAAARTVDTSAGTLSYDTLIYALGSLPERSAVPGVAEHAYTLSPQDAPRLLDALRAGKRRAVICGGGLTGIETAAELAEAGAQVTLVTRGVLGAGLSDAGRAQLRRVFARLGVTLVEHTDVTAVSADAVHTDARTFACDVCVWAGAFTVPPLARESGLAVNAQGQLAVDATLRSLTYPEIFAAGDSAGIVGYPVRMACATAMPLGAQAADNVRALLAGKTPQPFVMHYAIQCISLGRHDALVQRVNPDDSPRAQIITGAAGVLVKEGICRFTLLALALERQFPGAYPARGFSGGQRARVYGENAPAAAQ